MIFTLRPSKATTSKPESPSGSSRYGRTVRLTLVQFWILPLIAAVFPFLLARTGKLVTNRWNEGQPIASQTSFEIVGEGTNTANSNRFDESSSPTSHLQHQNQPIDTENSSKNGRKCVKEPSEQTKRRVLAKQDRKPFPLPILPEGKKPPRAKYTTKCFVEVNEKTAKKKGMQLLQLPLDELQNSPQYQADADSIVHSSAENVPGGQRQWSQNRINVHLHHPPSLESEQSIEAKDGADELPGHGCNCARNGNSTRDVENEEDDAIYQPAGQHLLIDIRHVDSSFLWDISRLAHAMVRVTELSKLTLLSYHCHELQPPMGVSCMGVLLESHISLHTWPEAGVMVLDLFTCGSSSLLPLLPTIEQLFAVPSNRSEDQPYSSSVPPKKPVMRWLHKKRGFRFPPPLASETVDSTVPSTALAGMPAELGHKSVDLEAYLLGWSGYEEKILLANVRTEFQHVQIYKASLTASAARDDKARKGPPTPAAALSLSAAGTNKLLYLDGVMRSSLQGLEAYHETLVQPALFMAQANQASRSETGGTRSLRVAILGGGEGATLREVLKHEAVKQVVMIEQDGQLVTLAKQYLPEWNDCSFLSAGDSPLNCFDDPRVTLYLEDAFSWFIERHGPDSSPSKNEDKFDVVLLDALDPSSMVGFADSQIVNDFFYALTHSLNEQDGGILVSQAGKLELAAKKASRQHTDHILHTFASLIQQHARAGVNMEMKTYDDGAHSQLLGPWEFRLAALRNGNPQDRVTWSDDFTPAWMNIQMERRTVSTKDDGRENREPLFRNFDEATFATLAYPSRVVQDNFCRYHQTDGVKDWICPSSGRRVALPENVGGLILSPRQIDLMRRTTHAKSKMDAILSGCRATDNDEKLDGGEADQAFSPCRLVVSTEDSHHLGPGASFLESGNRSAFFHPYADRNYLTWVAGNPTPMRKNESLHFVFGTVPTVLEYQSHLAQSAHEVDSLCPTTDFSAVPTSQAAVECES
mmetsp:Transcript_26683/g.61289  ORF Transcript_26683/g.61289 Transcript_26683/m.61289 type:complete len:982 (+) Transcript_26683:282-3227(+)